MIYSITSDLTSFKTLEFRDGLNILLADKSRGASDKQSRNGAGKTCVIELVHFLLGSRADPNSIFRSDALRSSSFSMLMDVSGEKIRVTRSGAKPNLILVDEFPMISETAEQTSAENSRSELSNNEWKQYLCEGLFGLPAEDASGFPLPGCRSLLSMFARRQESGGFQTPTKYFMNQSVAVEQKTISYLLGLDWTIAERFKRLKEDQKASADLLKAINSEEFSRHFGSVAELRSRLILTAARNKQLRKQIDAYRVIPEYAELEREASRITTEIGSLNAGNIADRELSEELEKSFQTEDIPAFRDLPRLYKEVDVILPDLAVRRLADVEIFHSRIVENRRSHLKSEIEAASMRIKDRNKRIDDLDSRRSQIMATLQTGGALEHFTRMQQEWADRESECQELGNRLKMGEELEEAKTKLKVKQSTLLTKLRSDIHERSRIVEDAVLMFESLSQSLYEQEGRLVITPTETGLKLETKIAAERSKGITNMQIFCFDFTLAALGARRGSWPGFIIHDSHLFDGVDERQVARALQIGAQCAVEDNFQYIVTMNSDAIPKDGFGESFNIDDHIMDVRLSDATETGGLFGIRFN
ncbi:MAG: DUF2326 domain-containing protein [Acidimicrobiaceae bacterium]|nr:DUF2326 domain-containing protein [Acidimicrobiaceae bacterium]